jgi:phosphatidylglycerol---prolipoprotein diacylglyceryl transferase
VHPVVFQTDFFGLLSQPLVLHAYGLFIAIGFMSAMLLAKAQANREGEDGDIVVDMAFWLLLWGLVGARSIFILTQLDKYLADPTQVLYFWRGGLVFYGGFIGAAICLIYYTRRHKLPFFKFADIFVPFLAMAHAFGRLGCLCAGCCFGKPTDMPWGIVFPKHSMPHQAHQEAGDVLFNQLPLAVHPTQLYEAGAELLMFFFLLSLRPKKRFHGQILLVWLAVYPVIRSVIELYRGDKIRGVYFLGLSTSQYISIGVALSAAIIYFFLRKKRDAQPA